MKKLIIVDARTKERRFLSFEEVFELNKGLIREVANEYYPTFEKYGDYDREDLYQEAYMALWNAFEKYDETKNYAFSTLATHCIKNAFNVIIKARKREKRKGDTDRIFLDKKLSDGEKENNDNYNLLIKDNFENEFLENKLLGEIYDSLTEREKLYLLVLTDEIKAVNLAEHLGVSRAAISKNIKKFKLKIEPLVLAIYRENI